VEVGVLPRTRRLGSSLANRTARPVNKQAASLSVSSSYMSQADHSVETVAPPNCCGNKRCDHTRRANSHRNLSR